MATGKGMMEETAVGTECRRDIYKILSDCYYLPDEGLLMKLKDLEASRCERLREMAARLQTPERVESLQIDYSALFVGPYGLLAPPYGSLYLENTRILMGESTIDVRRRYTEECLDLSIKEAPDHIAIELEFMYFLVHKEVEATLNSAPVTAADYVRKQKDFLGTHLCRWVTDFSRKVETNARTQFYKTLANLTETFVVNDLRSLSVA